VISQVAIYLDTKTSEAGIFHRPRRNFFKRATTMSRAVLLLLAAGVGLAAAQSCAVSATGNIAARSRPCGSIPESDRALHSPPAERAALVAGMGVLDPEGRAAWTTTTCPCTWAGISCGASTYKL
jgi:hypothetical protein